MSKDEDNNEYHEWSAYYDEAGELYYYNATTEESSWDAPEGGFNPPPSPKLDDDVDRIEPNSAADEDAAPEKTIKQEVSDEETSLPSPTRDSPEQNMDGLPQSPVEGPETLPTSTPNDQEYLPTSPPNDQENLPTSPPNDQENLPTSPPNDQEYLPTSPPNKSPQSPASPAPLSPSVDTEHKDQSGTTEKENSGGTIQWIAYKDEDDQEYYYNNETGETQWEKPDNFITAEEFEESEEQDQNEGTPEHEEPEESPMTPEDVEPPSPEEEIEEVEVEPEIDPEIVKLQNAEDALSKPDSILEPSCIANVSVVVPAHGGKPEKAIKSLIDAYHGQTAVCGLLARWFVDFKQLANSTTPATTGKQQLDNSIMHIQQQHNLEADANYIRQVAQDVINRIANERFTREAGDNILELGKSDVAFLEEMMDSPRWRKLLIDLSAPHKDSAVLLYCLRAISKKGHHREIAKRINQSDHFAVFNAMLLSELAVVGCTAVSAGSDIASSSGFDELLNDLQRACSATSYTYLYSVEMLRTLEAMALKEAVRDRNRLMEQCRFQRAIRKWQAMIQLLDNAMIDPAAAQSVAGSSPLFRKRRLDVALTISEFHQRQRRRRLNTETDKVEGVDLNNIDNQKDLETTILMLLRRYSTGTQIGDAVIDKLLPSGLDMDTRKVGKLLLKHPLSIRALLGHMYKPGATRINSVGTKNKCARLVALAVLEAEEMARDHIRHHHRSNNNNGELNLEEEIDEVALTRMIVQGTQLCEQLETMISFSVTTETNNNITAASPGQKLCTLALKCAPVALGTIMWAREFTHPSEFSQSASFPTISPSVMSLVRLIAVRHPFTRSDALHVALAYLRHSNPDISYQKVNSLKEQALRILLFLLVEGDVVPVLSSVTNRLSNTGTSELDASLVRYFVGSILEVVRPPFSPVFLRLFGQLLYTAKTIDAVRSTYFAKDSRQKLEALLQSFKSAKQRDGKLLDKDDIALVSSLLTTYQIE